VGAEPVVIDVYAYAGDGKAAVSDASTGTRVAQLSASCSDSPAFARPIDVTAIVRQMAVPAGVRFVGFNIRKANNRQGPSLFALTAGKLTVVLADQALVPAPQARGHVSSPGAVPPTAPSSVSPAPVLARAAAASPIARAASAGQSPRAPLQSLVKQP